VLRAAVYLNGQTVLATRWSVDARPSCRLGSRGRYRVARRRVVARASYLVAVQVPDWWALLVHFPDIARPLAEIPPTKVATYPGAKLL